jgi:tRNA(Arg) A34 adenosine deaminase TadA
LAELGHRFVSDPPAQATRQTADESPSAHDERMRDVDRETDLTFLRRCVDLARAALDEGDEPFGSVLVDAAGEVRFEDRNRVQAGDETRHPELEVARWSASYLTADERAASTVYTSGEHCPMCSAAHAWMGLGPIVYAASSAQLVAWRTSWGLPASPVLPLAINEVAPGVEVRGPFVELEDELVELHRRKAEIYSGSLPESPPSR